MKVSAKRRRSRMQVQEDKLREKNQKLELEQRLQQLEAYEAQVREMQQKMQRTEAVKEQIDGLFNDGLITQDGENQFRVVTDQTERQQIQSMSKRKGNV